MSAKTTIPIETIYKAIKENPGITRADLIKTTGIHRGSLDSRLATLNNKGYLLSEDQYGRIYPYF